MKDSPPLQGLQIRAARALLGWSQSTLATKANVARPTIALAERGKSVPWDETLIRLKQAFEAAGITFVNDGQQVGATRKVA
ncbi:helix-turn-helix transcriptional regulator [Devosia sp.]|jgi:transcriptional regulator with XRE-family HTH domain|uniref:helix-turn-helix transcriptional regulator n=1 Tax=Devosia sp. TaxID=1871048 RepID=UPI0037C18F6D